MLVVTELVSIVSEKVTETVDVIETDVSPSEGELDDTVGGVVSVVVVVLSVVVVESLSLVAGYADMPAPIRDGPFRQATQSKSGNVDFPSVSMPRPFAPVHFGRKARVR